MSSARFTAVMLCILMVPCSTQRGEEEKPIDEPRAPPGPREPATSSPTTTSPAPPSAQKYLLMAPKIIRPGQPYIISIHMFGLKDTRDIITYSASLRSSSDTQDLVSVIGDSLSNELTLPVPLNAPRSQYKLTVTGKWKTGDNAGMTEFSETATISTQQKSMSIFVQTDKAIYKPGQKVMFRVLATFPNMKPYMGPMNISIYDPNDNKVLQLLNQQNPAHGVTKNEMEISDQPLLGDYKIKVNAAGQRVEKVFTVDEYVLPKFEVKVIVPSFVVDSASAIEIAVEAKYTYGKPVKGYAFINVKLNYQEWELRSVQTPVPELKFNIAEFNGRVSRTITRAQFLHLVAKPFWYNMPNEWDPQTRLNGKRLNVTASVTEGVSGKTMHDDAEAPIENARLKLEFLSATPSSFKPGLEYIGFVKLSLADGQPPAPSDLVAADGSRHLMHVRSRNSQYNQETRRYETKYIEKEYPVPASGLVRFSFMVPMEYTRFDMQANFDNIFQWKYGISKFNSRSNNGIQVSLEGMENGGAVKSGAMANFLVRVTNESLVNSFQLQLLSKGVLVMESKVVSPVTSRATHVPIYISTSVAQRLSPAARVVVWCVAESEIVSDSLDFNVEGAFTNNVDLSFNVDETQPGKDVELTVSAYKNSYAGLLAVDQSVLLLKSGNDISQDQVLDELSTYDSNGKSSGGGPMPRPMMIDCRFCGMPIFSGGTDASTVFENAGVVIMTNVYIYKVQPRIYFGRPMARGAAGRAGPQGEAGMVASEAGQPAATGRSGATSASAVRRVFPETWLWADSDDVGEDGKWKIQTKVPDTITSWVVSAFAVSQIKGLGVAPNAAKMNVFKPFFVSLNLPYSVIRGEEFAVQAMVFNYLPVDLEVTVTLFQSEDFSVRPPNAIDTVIMKDMKLRVKVPADDSRSVSFWIVPGRLGSILLRVKAETPVSADTLERVLLVEPEGSPQDYSRTVIYDFSQQQDSHKQTIEIAFPDDVVSDSQHIAVTAIGEMMGSSIRGLGKLLRMPYGCGEQNMLNFAPGITIAKYLKSTNQMTGEFQAKAFNVMQTGYKRELQYQHSDGSFSAFGERDASGSMWLTAFVMKSFTKAQEFIEIDPQIIDRAARWIFGKQTMTGVFVEPKGGRVIHKDMQGGSAKGIALHAYVLSALKESQGAFSEYTRRKVDSAIGKATSHLISELSSLVAADDPYDMAIATYAISLVDRSLALKPLEELKKLAIKEGGMVHWEKPDEKEEVTYEHWRRPYHQASSSDIELTAYMLSTYCLHEERLTALPLMKWLASQQNPNGGFSSTQDTVVALHAMAELAGKLQGSKVTEMDVSITSEGKTSTFDRITNTNALVMQSLELPETTRQIEIDVNGQGLAIVQVSVSYNVHSEDNEPGVLVNVNTKDLGSGRKTVRACGRYTKTGESGMAIMDVEILTGSQADTSDLMNTVPGLKRIEKKERSVIFYLDQLENNDTCLEFNTHTVMAVSNVQPARVSGYLYYKKDKRHTVYYSSTDSSSICEKCPDCCDGSLVDSDEEPSSTKLAAMTTQSPSTEKTTQSTPKVGGLGDDGATLLPFTLLIVAMLAFARLL